MARIILVACLMLVTTCTWSSSVASGASAPQQSPSPAPSTKDCSSIIFNMASCLPFLSNGGKVMKPDSSCCSGFKSVLEVNADCICEALKSSASLGIDLNMTKAMNLPSACGMSAPPISKCGIKPPSPHKKTPSPAPSPPSAPAPSPSSAPAPSDVKTPPPSNPGQAPSPAPFANTGTYSTSASLKVIVIGMLVASFCIISV